jgi:hypothetical protein
MSIQRSLSKYKALLIHILRVVRGLAVPVVEAANICKAIDEAKPGGQVQASGHRIEHRPPFSPIGFSGQGVQWPDERAIVEGDGLIAPFEYAPR